MTDQKALHFALYVRSESGDTVLTIKNDGTIWVNPDHANEAAHRMVELYRHIVAALPVPPAPAITDEMAEAAMRERMAQTGEKHDGCDYFVLDLTHDPLAFPAIAAYERFARAAGYVALADDLIVKLIALRDLYFLSPAEEIIGAPDEVLLTLAQKKRMNVAASCATQDHRMTPDTPPQPLCVDEGCPHFGTPHVCTSKGQLLDMLRAQTVKRIDVCGCQVIDAGFGYWVTLHNAATHRAQEWGGV